MKHTSAGTGTENVVLVVMVSGWVPSLDQNRRQLRRARIACGLPGEPSGVLVINTLTWHEAKLGEGFDLHMADKTK